MLPYTALDALQAMLMGDAGDGAANAGPRTRSSRVARRTARWLRRWMAGGLA